MFRSNVNVGRGCIVKRQPIAPKPETKAEFTRRMIIKMARPVAPKTADPAAVSVRNSLIAAGHIKPIGVAAASST